MEKGLRTLRITTNCSGRKKGGNGYDLQMPKMWQGIFDRI